MESQPHVRNLWRRLHAKLICVKMAFFKESQLSSDGQYDEAVH